MKCSLKSEHPLESKSFPRFLVFWVTLAGVIVICLYGVEESKLLIKELDEVCEHFILLHNV